MLEHVGRVADVEGRVGERQLHPAARAPCGGRSLRAPTAHRRRRRGRSTWPPLPRTRSGSSPVPRRRRASARRRGRRSGTRGRPRRRRARRRRRRARSARPGRRGTGGRTGAAWEPRPTEWTRTAAARGDCSRWWDGGPRFATVRWEPTIGHPSPVGRDLIARVVASTAVEWEDTPADEARAQSGGRDRQPHRAPGPRRADGRAHPHLGASPSSTGSVCPPTVRSACS